MIDRLFPGFLVMLTMGGCDYSSVRDETSEFYAVPVGSILILNTEITIPPDQVSVLLQDGSIKKHADVNLYYPNCKFELYSISENSRIVRPDRFTITKVVEENEFTSLQKPLYVSRRLMSNDAPETITYATVFYLNSEIQPDVYRMTCKHWESVVVDRYLTISEMRKVMWDVFSLMINY